MIQDQGYKHDREWPSWAKDRPLLVVVKKHYTLNKSRHTKPSVGKQMNWKKQVNQKWILPLFFMMFGLFIAETVAIFYMATLTATLASLCFNAWLTCNYDSKYF